MNPLTLIEREALRLLLQELGAHPIIGKIPLNSTPALQRLEELLKQRAAIESGEADRQFCKELGIEWTL